MTTLREAAQQALEAFELWCPAMGHALNKRAEAVVALRAALAEYDKDRVKVEEMKANWALQRKLAEETQERDKQQREYEEQRLAALAEPVQEPVQEPVHEHEKWCASVTQLLLCDPPRKAPCNCKPTAPPQRKPLTDEKVCDLWSWSMTAEAERTATTQQHAFARAIERAHGIEEKA